MYCYNGPYCEPGEKCCCHKDVEEKSNQASKKLTKKMFRNGVGEFAIDAIIAFWFALIIAVIIYHL